jgi:ribosomal protein L40E
MLGPADVNITALGIDNTDLRVVATDFGQAAQAAPLTLDPDQDDDDNLHDGDEAAPASPDTVDSCCVACGAELPAEAAFCPGCGGAMPEFASRYPYVSEAATNRCSGCGRLAEAARKVCLNCGARTSGDSGRRSHKKGPDVAETNLTEAHRSAIVADLVALKGSATESHVPAARLAVARRTRQRCSRE